MLVKWLKRELCGALKDGEAAAREGLLTLHTSQPGQGKRRLNLKGCFGRSSHGGEWPVPTITAGSNGHEAGVAGGQVMGISIRESSGLHTGRSLPTSDCHLLIPTHTLTLLRRARAEQVANPVKCVKRRLQLVKPPMNPGGKGDSKPRKSSCQA
jgi:hypothetical protein